MSIEDNKFIQEILESGEVPLIFNMGYTNWPVDGEIIPLLRYFWKNGIETFNSCASHVEVSTIEGWGYYFSSKPYVVVDDTSMHSPFIVQLEKEVDEMGYRMEGREDTRYLATRLEFINKSINQPKYSKYEWDFRDNGIVIGEVEELIEKNHNFLSKFRDKEN